MKIRAMLNERVSTTIQKCIDSTFLIFNQQDKLDGRLQGAEKAIGMKRRRKLKKFSRVMSGDLMMNNVEALPDSAGQKVHLGRVG